MIEVEKKFLFKNENDLQFLSQAKFLLQKEMVDIYYDDDDFSLTSKNIWLRSRDDMYELKVPVMDNVHGNFDTYNEITIEKDILNFFSWGEYTNLKQALLVNNYKSFCVCETTRKKYKLDNFNIDVDLVNFDGFVYNILEIEILVENENDIQNATKQIIAFAQKNNLSLEKVKGKIIEYLRQRKFKHYHKLVSVGVVRE